jgi:LysM repeat protein
LGWLAALALCLGVSGCWSSGSSPLDEQREPHFLLGKSRVNSLDYKGAIEAFEKALEVNPRSASAHFELGLLYENNEQDFAAAIYHFDRFLKLRPNSEYAEIVNQRILACKQELAKTVSLVPVAQTMQRDLERLADENRDLRQKLEAWQNYYSANAARLAGASSPPTNTPPQPAVRSAQPAAGTAAPSGQPATATARPSAAAAATRAYTIKQGDTPAAIARRYGVKLDALLAANPGLDPKHLKIGQTVQVPAP